MKKEQFYFNGNLEVQEWFLDGKLHNEEGPASIWFYENGNIEKQSWCLNDEYHNEEGPALIGYHEDGKVKFKVWYLNDKQLTKEDFTSLDMIKKMNAFDFFSALEIARFKI
jgi:antitoxin component YwqK of YwqJK toxin-antitoxin module